MKKIKAIVLLVLFAISVTPLSLAAQTYSFKTEKVIVVLPGESFNDSMVVVNTLPVNLTLVVYLGYSVEGAPSGFNFTPLYSVFKDWKSGESQSIAFNFTVGSEVPEGDYALVVKFRGIDDGGALYTISLRVPVEVRKNPLILSEIDHHVLERPQFGDPFRGENLIVHADVLNIGRYPTGARVNITVFDPKGSVAYRDSIFRMVLPGEEDFEFKIPVGWDWNLGEYHVNVTLTSPYGEEGKTFKFSVDNGVRILNVSKSTEMVFKGDEMGAYLTLLSERKLESNITVEVFKGSKLLKTSVFPLNLSPGTEVFTIQLPTDISGELFGRLSLTRGGFVLESVNLSYSVLDYPKIFDVASAINSTGPLHMEISVLNPNDVEVNCSLYYELHSSGALLYSDAVELRLKPGYNNLTLDFIVPRNSTITYILKLIGDGRVFYSESSSMFIPPAPTRTESIGNTTVPTNSTGAGGGKGNSLFWIAGAVVIIILGALVFYVLGSREEGGYVSPWERARKPRTRPKPKRRSPLGRFKRPKLPKFIENRELPKRFRRRPVAKTRKKKE